MVFRWYDGFGGKSYQARKGCKQNCQTHEYAELHEVFTESWNGNSIRPGLPFGTANSSLGTTSLDERVSHTTSTLAWKKMNSLCVDCVYCFDIYGFLLQCRKFVKCEKRNRRLQTQEIDLKNWRMRERCLPSHSKETRPRNTHPSNRILVPPRCLRRMQCTL